MKCGYVCHDGGLEFSHMKRFPIFFLLVLLFSIFDPLSLGADQLKIAIFDMQRIMRESRVIEEYRQEIMKEMEPRRKAFLEKQEYLRHIEEKLKKNGRLSVAERKSLQEKFLTELKELRRMAEDMDMEFRKKDAELTQKVLGEIGVIIKQIARTEDFALILERTSAGVVHFKDSIDITDKILKMYDRR